jgi:hypothetical protein
VGNFDEQPWGASASGVNIVALALGAAIGRLLLAGFHWAFGIDTSTSRIEYARSLGTERFVESSIDGGLILIFSLYAAWWIVVAWLGWHAARRAPRLAVALVVVHTVLAVAVFVTRDQTRVFAMLSWPVVLWLLLWAHESIDRVRFGRLTTLALGVSMAFPLRPDLLDGRARGSMTPELVHWIFG